MTKVTNTTIEKLAEKKAKLEAKLSDIERKEKVEYSKERVKKRKAETQAKIIFASLILSKDGGMRRMLYLELQAISKRPTTTERQRADLEKVMKSDFYQSIAEGF